MFPCAMAIGCVDGRWVIPMTFVFSRLIFSPTCALCSSSLEVIPWHTFSSSASIAKSSVKSRPLNGSVSARWCHTPACPWFCAWQSQWLWWRGMVKGCSTGYYTLHPSRDLWISHLRSNRIPNRIGHYNSNLNRISNRIGHNYIPPKASSTLATIEAISR